MTEAPASGAITIGIPPEFDLGPLVVSWHGLMTALGIVAATWIGTRLASRRGLDPDFVTTLAIAAAAGGIVGARLLYLALESSGDLLDPLEWVGSNGFAIFGGVAGGAIAAVLVLRFTGKEWRYLDVLAVGFPLGIGVGRIGDVINGEHYGPPTDLPWGVVHTHPDALVPETGIAYHDGGLYESVLGFAIFALVWPLRDRFRTPTMTLWFVLTLYGLGRFAMFFVRSDSEPALLGLNVAQLISLALVAIALTGAWLAKRTYDEGRPQPD